MALFPGALPAAGSASASATLAAAGHTSLHNTGADESRAIATKVGTGSSTPTSTTVLTGTGVGTSSWAQVNLTTMVMGTLPVASGGTGTTTSTGSGSVVLSTSPTISAPTIAGGGSWSGSPVLSTPTIADFTNAQHDHSDADDGGVLANNIIKNAMLSTDAGEIGAAWQTWVPSYANLSGGTTNFAKYIQIGKIVYWRWQYTLAGAGVGTGPTVSLPVTAHADYVNTNHHDYGQINIRDDSATQTLRGVARVSTTTAMLLSYHTVSGTNIGIASLTSTAPITFASPDVLSGEGFYEAA